MIEVIQSSGIYAVVLVVVIAVASLLGLVLFASREEKFEDVVAAQKRETEALIDYLNTSSKTTKGKKKQWVKKKGKGGLKPDDKVPDVDLVEIEQQEVPSVETSAEPEHDVSQPPIKEEVLKKKKGGKKGGKKAHKPEVVVEEDVIAADEGNVEAERDDFTQLDEDLHYLPELQAKEPVPEPVTVKLDETLENVINEMMQEAAPSQSSKKPKNKKPKSQTQKSGEKFMSLGQLMKEVETSPLSNEDVQTLIDALFDKQNELLQWQKPNQKGEQKVDFRQQVQELQTMLEDERKTSQLTAQRLKESRNELNSERSQSQAFQTQANGKIGQQAKEIQALQKRMEASHEKHSLDMQSAQTQIQRMQELIDGSSSVEVSRLKEEIAHLQKASMRVKQLMEDNKSLINELNQVQQNNKQLRAEVDSTLSQVTAYERKMTQLQMDKGETEGALSNQLKEVKDRLTEVTTEKESLSESLEAVQKELEELRSAQIEQAQQSLTSANESAIQVLLDESTREIGELKTALKVAEDKLKESEDEKAKRVMVNGDARDNDDTDNSNESHKEEAVGKLTLELKNAQTALETVTKEKEEAVIRLEKEISELKEQGVSAAINATDELKNDIQERKEELKRIEIVVEQLKTKNNELREKNWKAMDAVGAAEENAKKKVKELEFTTIEFLGSLHPDVKIKKNEPLSVVLDQYKEGISQILTKNNNNDELESVREENKSLLSKMGDLESTANAKSQAKIEELENKLRAAEETEKNASLQAEHYKRTLEETESMLTKLKDGVESEVSSWKNKNEAMKTDLDGANQKVSTLETQLKELSEKATQSANTSVPADLERIKGLEDVIVSLEQRFADKSKECEDALSKEKRLTESCASATAEVNSLKTAVSKLEATISTNQDTNAKDKRIKELEEANSSLEEQLREERDRVIVDVEIPGGSREEIKKELNSTKEQLEAEQKAHGGIKEKVTRLETELSDLKKLLNTKEEECGQATGKAKETEDRYKQALERLAMAEGKIEELENANLTKSQQIEKEINDAMTQLKTSLSEKDKALEAERQANRQLRVQLAALTSSDGAHGTSV